MYTIVLHSSLRPTALTALTNIGIQLFQCRYFQMQRKWYLPSHLWNRFPWFFGLGVFQDFYGNCWWSHSSGTLLVNMLNGSISLNFNFNFSDFKWIREVSVEFSAFQLCFQTSSNTFGKFRFVIALSGFGYNLKLFKTERKLRTLQFFANTICIHLLKNPVCYYDLL